jgi:hypothetical protein
MFLPFSKRGQAWEPIGLELRRLLQLRSDDRLDPWALAPLVGLHVADAATAFSCLGTVDRVHLLGPGRAKWSGGVYPQPLPDGKLLCILNPTHSARRNKITLMEEIVHAHRAHRPSSLVFEDDGLRFRDYDAGHEEEAYGVGAAALLPWQTFFKAVNVGAKIDDLAETYDVTPDLVLYRIKITGLYAVFRKRQQRGA